jgi:hypothetical protein
MNSFTQIISVLILYMYIYNREKKTQLINEYVYYKSKFLADLLVLLIFVQKLL